MGTMTRSARSESLRSDAPKVAKLLASQTEPSLTFEVTKTGDKTVKEKVVRVAWHYCISLDGERYWVQTDKTRWNVYSLEELSDAHALKFFVGFRKILARHPVTEPAA